MCMMPPIRFALAAFTTPDATQQVLVHDAIAYLAAGQAGPLVDVAQPLQPIEIGYFQSSDRTAHVAIARNRIYVADRLGDCCRV